MILSLGRSDSTPCARVHFPLSNAVPFSIELGPFKKMTGGSMLTRRLALVTSSVTVQMAPISNRPRDVGNEKGKLTKGIHGREIASRAHPDTSCTTHSCRITLNQAPVL